MHLAKCRETAEYRGDTFNRPASRGIGGRDAKRAGGYRVEERHKAAWFVSLCDVETVRPMLGTAFKEYYHHVLSFGIYCREMSWNGVGEN